MKLRSLPGWIGNSQGQLMGTVETRQAASGKCRFRARVRLSGLPEKAKTFSYREDAETWIRQQENSLTHAGKLARKIHKSTRTQMPPDCACYALFEQDRCIYVGSSNGNVLGRIANHARRIKFNSYTVMECDPADLLAEEYRMISALQPEQNKLGRKPSNDRVEGRDAASSRRVPSHDGLAGNG
jgi:hypothetical protein